MAESVTAGFERLGSEVASLGVDVRALEQREIANRIRRIQKLGKAGGTVTAKENPRFHYQPNTFDAGS